MHDWGIVDRPAALFEIRNAANCKVSYCTFTKSGGGGLRLDRYSQNVVVNNNTFSNLGREAVSLTGRGPGYGDVNKSNEVGYNTMTATGREKWDAPAIMIDQSSNNWIHHNTIADTHFSTIIFISSRGIYVAAKAYEDSDSYFIGGEAHYWEVAPVALQHMLDDIDLGEAPFVTVQQYFYNYNNVIEKNVITNGHNGDSFYDFPGTPTNGVIYSSGGTHQATNFLQLNYVYDVTPGDTQFYYQDAYTDNVDVLKNMLYNLQLTTEGGVFDVYINTELPATGRGLVRSNVVKSSNYEQLALGWSSLQLVGNIDLDSGIPAGSATVVKDYEEMVELLCPGNLPGPQPLPGAGAMQADLASKISAFGGTVTSCTAIFSDGFESGDVSRWSSSVGNAD